MRVWSHRYGPRGVGALVYLEAGAPSIMLEYRVDGKRKYLNLEHKDRKRAMGEVKLFVDTRMKGEPSAAPALPADRGGSVGRLVEDFLASEYVLSLSPDQQRKNRSALNRWLAYLGRSRPVLSLHEEDVWGYLNARRRGSHGLPAAGGQQTHYNDFSALRAALRWAMRTKDASGSPLLSANPLFGVRVGVEKNPVQAEITHEDYLRLRRASRKLHHGIRLFLLLAEMTGRRENSIRLLRWEDVNFRQGTIRFRAEADKEGYDAVVPVSDRLLWVLAAYRKRFPDHAYLVQPFRGKPRPYSLSHVNTWMARIYEAAGMEKPERAGWHSFRRKLINELKYEPDEEVMVLTGHRSLAAFRRYRKPRAEQVRALANRRRSAEK